MKRRISAHYFTHNGDFYEVHVDATPKIVAVYWRPDIRGALRPLDLRDLPEEVFEKLLNKLLKSHHASS